MLIDENKALKARIAKLEAALDPFVRLEQAIMNDIRSAHSNRPGATEAMRDADWDMRSDLREAFKIARAALSAMPSAELLREALEALTYLIADMEAAHTSGALSNPPPTAHELANLRRARVAADKIRAAMGGE